MVMDAVVSSECILDEARRLWVNSRGEYRDALISVGGLLGDFILARLYEGDGLPEAQRIRNQLTRERSMRIAAETLAIPLMRAYELIRIAKVVELFGDPGSLSYTTLRVFTVLVRRRPCKIARGVAAKAGLEVTPSESEAWEIKPVKGTDPKAMYRRAVEEVWESRKTREAIRSEMTLHRRGGVGPKPRMMHRSDPLSLRSLAHKSDPKDLVDMVVEMIDACPRAAEFKQLLVNKIKSL